MTASPDTGVVLTVDAMGGDGAPACVVEGAVLAARELDAVIELVGPSDAIEALLARVPDRGALRLAVVDAPGWVEMADRPAAAVRRGRATSIRVAMERLADGRAAGLFSAGHTGATVMAACTTLGMVAGVDRAALAVTVPTPRGAAVLLDVGATVDCRAQHLLHFAVMGAAYARVALGLDAPRVGLLSIGEEALKGNDLTREAFRLLEASGLPFIGNVEARDLFTGQADVVVCDGFTGNVALKVSEGLVETVEAMLEAELGASPASRAGARLAAGAFERFRRRVDSSEFGGAPLLGVDGLCVVGHGRASARAVRSGIGLTHRFAVSGLVPRLAAAAGSPGARCR